MALMRMRRRGQRRKGRMEGWVNGTAIANAIAGKDESMSRKVMKEKRHYRTSHPVSGHLLPVQMAGDGSIARHNTYDQSQRLVLS